MTMRDMVHRLKYNGKDCIGESLRVIVGPDFHSSFCDDAEVELVDFVAEYADCWDEDMEVGPFPGRDWDTDG